MQADWRWVFLVNVPVGLVGLVSACARCRAARARRRTPGRARRLALIVAIGSLVVAIVKGQEWGWTSPAILALLVVTAVLLPAIWWRSEHHAAPIVEPAMLRVRSFGLAVGASVLFFAGFGAMLLAGVLFLTAVWHESVLTAGLMLFPGPAMATAFSVPSARLGARVGYRIPGMVGALLFVRRTALVHHPDRQHARLSVRVPAGHVISGAGVGLVIPTLTGAGPPRCRRSASRRARRSSRWAARSARRSASRCSWRCSARHAGRRGLPLGMADNRRRGTGAGLVLAALGRPAHSQLAVAASRAPVVADASAIAEPQLISERAA